MKVNPWRIPEFPTSGSFGERLVGIEKMRASGKPCWVNGATDRILDFDE